MIERDKKLVRGLDYYSGTCFEMKCTHERAFSVLGLDNYTCLAGGRYDGLTRKFGRDTQAVGWAAGLERLAVVIKEIGMSINTEPEN